MKARAALIAACVLAPVALAPVARAAGPAFDGARAWKDLQALAAVGPRRAGSDGMRRARGLVVERLRQAGFRAREAPFGPAALANVIGERAGSSDELVVVGARFDAADGPAALLELARALSAAPLARTVRLVFFDGSEEPLAGSRVLASEMDRAGELARVRALITLSGVADTDLRLETSVLAAPELVTRTLAAARKLGLESLLQPLPRAHFDGDHLPFARLGLRAVLPLADLRAPPPVHSRESLARAGALVLELTRGLAGAHE